jgi:hypothetical protein
MSTTEHMRFISNRNDLHTPSLPHTGLGGSGGEGGEVDVTKRSIFCAAVIETMRCEAAIMYS